MWGVVSAAILALVASVVYMGIGLWFVRRGVDSRARPFRAFATYWFGIGAYGVLESLWAIGVVAFGLPLHVGEVVLHLKVLVGVVAFWGLVAYMLTIYTGRDLLAPTAVAYALLYVLVEYHYVWRDPIGQKIDNWGVALTYANESLVLWRLVVLLLFVPPLLSTLAYAFLLRVTDDPRVRRRIRLISLGLIAFFAGTTLGWLNGHWPWWGLAEKVIALATGLGVLAAILPGEAPPDGPASGSA